MIGIVFIGDSVTLGSRPGVFESDTFVSKIASGRSASYVNAGIGGNNSSQMAARFAADVLAQDPQWVGIMSGINDVDVSIPLATYKSNLGWMIDQARAAGAFPVLFTPTPTNDSVLLPGLPAYVQACRQVAADKNAPLVDAYAAFCEIAVYPGGTAYTGLFVDSQHPGPSGHSVIAGLLDLPQHAALFVVSSEGGIMYQSSEQTITSGAAINLSHGLGDTPTRVDFFLKCTEAELESSVGDMVAIAPGAIYDGSNSRGFTARLTSTEIKIRFGSGANVFMMHNSSGSAASPTNSKWKLIVRAYP